MPRTGGRSLAKQIGVRKLIGTMHDGPGQIPDPWREYPTVATMREQNSWEKSMISYLIEIGSIKEMGDFINITPEDLINGMRIDPTFGLWDDPEEYFLKFALEGYYMTWFDLYYSYFVIPADRIVPIGKLTQHIR